MFDRLIELVTLISKTKIQRVEIIDEKHNYNTKVQHLYEGINNGSFKSDKDAVKTLYQTDDTSYNAYVQLRYQLERRLLNTLFHIDITEAKYTDSEVAHYNCHREMAQIAVMVDAKFNKAATIRKAASYVKKLELQPLEKSKQGSNVEFVPYEHIWACVLDSL